MKKIVLILFAASAVSFFSCKKSESNSAVVKTSSAVITGFDPNKCGCCWGWIINIDGSSYKFDKVPVSSTIDLNNLTYPTPVNVTWSVIQGKCDNSRIEVLSISQ